MKRPVYTNWLVLLLLMLQTLSSYAQLQGPYSQIDPTHVYKIINRATGQCLEVGGGGDLTAPNHTLTMWGYWGGAHQQWRFTYTNTSHYAIVNINSNACLTHDLYPSGSNPSGIVQSNNGYPNPILDPQGPTGQWDLDLIGNSTSGTIKAFSSRAQAGDYLTHDPNVGVKLSRDNNQIWDIIDVNADPNVYEIVNAWSGSMMQANQFDYGVSQSTGYTATYNGISPYAPSFYHWQLSAYDGNSNLNIINRFTQQVLALDGNALGSTTNIANNSGAANQKWVFLDINTSRVLTVAEATDGRQVKIYNRANGKVLQVDGSGTDLFQEGKAINQWTDEGHPWQRWYIRRVSPSGIGIAPTLVSSATSSLDPTHVYKIVHHATGEALEVSGGGDQTQNGRQIGVWPYWGGANQQWKLVPYTYPGTNTTTYAIVNRNSNSDMIANTARELRQSGNGYGGWTLNLTSTSTGLQGTIAVSGSTATRSLSSEKFLSGGQDASGNNSSHQALITADQSQLWDIIDVSTNPSVYKIFNNYSSNLLLTANEDGSVAMVFDYVKFDARNQWSFAAQGNGYVKVISRIDQRALGIDNNSIYNDSNGRVYNAGTQSSENWVLRDISNSRTLTLAEATDGRAFTIFNATSGKVLQMSGIDANGSDNTPNSYPRRANQWNYEGHPWQQWKVKYESANRMAAPSVTPAVIATVFTLYPNPVHDVLTLSLPGNANPTTVKVTDVRGSTVAVHYQGNNRIDVSSLSSGFYLLTVSDGQQEYHQKFTKE